MSLKVAIVGLPNVGKSTLFNALLKKQASFAEATAGQASSNGIAQVGNYPFTTIDPNVGIVPVPDSRLEQLALIINHQSSVMPPIVPATVEFVDIAGLIAGASKGEGLGNKFLSHIRETDAIAHVVRHFNDNDIIKTGTNPKEDLEVIETELALSDLDTLEKQREPKKTEIDKDKDKGIRWNAVLKLKLALEGGKPARSVTLTEDEAIQAKQLNLLTSKPILVVLNVSEEALKNANEIEQKYADEFEQGDPLHTINRDQIVAICAKTESELAALEPEEQKEYMQAIGIGQSALDKLAQKAFKTLGLITFLTAGEKEVRAWTINNGTNALQASGVIHTDFMDKFIKAEIVKYDDFISCSGWKGARIAGKARLEGKEYIMRDGDVVEFKIGA